MMNGNGLTDAELEKVSGGTGAEEMYERAVQRLETSLTLIEMYEAEPDADEGTVRMLKSYCRKMIASLKEHYREEADFQKKSAMRVLEAYRGESKNLQEVYTLFTNLYR